MDAGQSQGVLLLGAGKARYGILLGCLGNIDKHLPVANGCGICRQHWDEHRGRWAVGKVGDGNAGIRGNLFILGKGLLESRPGMTNSLVTVSKGADNSYFARAL